MFSGYENFVSRFELGDQKYKPAWMGHVGFGELKLKLLTSIVAISAVHLLESFMNFDHSSDPRARMEHWNSNHPHPHRAATRNRGSQFRARAALTLVHAAGVLALLPRPSRSRHENPSKRWLEVAWMAAHSAA